MTSLQPISPKSDDSTNPPPRKRRKDDGGEDKDGKNVDASIDDDLFGDGDCGGVNPTIDEAEDEVYYAELTQAQSQDKDPFVCVPCDSRIPRMLNAPIAPSEEAIAEHYTTHLPYRNWCPVCVKSKGKEDKHKTGANKLDRDDTGGLPIFSLDYNDIEVDAVKTIVGKDEVTGATIHHKVTCKGPGDEWVVKMILKDLEELGRRDIILKTDGEPAMLALQARIQAMRSGRTVPRNPPTYDPQANGPCEKAVQDTAAHTRALKLSLESRLKTSLSIDLPIIEWAIEHASFLLNRYGVGKDGMTPLERLTGRKWRRPIVELGEVVMAKFVTKKKKHGKVKQQKKKLAPRSTEAVWVGQSSRTGEHIVVLPNGDAMRCRTVRRVPIEKRWNVDMIRAIQGTPRVPAPSRTKSDRIDRRLADDAVAEAALPRPATVGSDKPMDGDEDQSGAALHHPEHRHREVDIREVRITDQILETYGGPDKYTQGCKECERKRQGMAGRRTHSMQCRQRIYDAMLQDEKGQWMVREKEKRMQRKAEIINTNRESAGQKAEASEELTAEKTSIPSAQCPSTPRFGYDEQNDNAIDDELEAPMLDSDVDSVDILAEEPEDETMFDPDTEDEETVPVKNSEKRHRDDEDDEENRTEDEDEPNTKKQRLVPVYVKDVNGKSLGLPTAEMPAGTSASGSPVDHTRDSSALRDRQDGQATRMDGSREEIRPKRSEGCDQSRTLQATTTRPMLGRRVELNTSIGHDLAGVPRPQHYDDAARLQLLQQLQAMRSSTEVREIIRQIESSANYKLKIPKKLRRPLNHHGRADVAEVYSPPRITEVAAKMGLQGGWALDLSTNDPDDGEPWDFTVPKKRAKVKKMLKEDKPFMLITCPMCGPFSSMSNFSYMNKTKNEVEGILSKAMEHLKFCMELCLMQYQEGRLFLFEHPVGASSWQSDLVNSLAKLEGIYKTNFDFCTLGMRTGQRPGDDTHAAMKRTTVMTNAHSVHTLLREAQCRGDHGHMPLENGRAGPCQEYPEKFSRIICEGIRRELDTIKWRNKLCEVFDITTPFGKLMKIQQSINELPVPPEEEDFLETIYEGYSFVDDVTGNPLQRSLAINARRVEMDYFRQMGVYTKVRKESWMKVISTKWLDINKGDEVLPNYRSRLVGCEFKRDKRDDLFAATPPLESLRVIISICANNQYHAQRDNRFIIMSTDVKRAYFYAPATRPVFIKIPAEDREPGDEDMVGRLNLSLYGTRDAAMNWSATYTDFLTKIGFTTGNASPCNFYHPIRRISITVHGDDFTSTAREQDLKWLKSMFNAKFEVTNEFLGPGEGHARQVRILNRVISWTDDGIQYEADQRHAEVVIRQLGLEGAKPVSTPGSRDDAGKLSAPATAATTTTTTTSQHHNDDAAATTTSTTTSRRNIDDGAGTTTTTTTPRRDNDDEVLLAGEEATLYRAIVARLNYLAQDRPDLQYASKEVSRRMATPRRGDWAALKRIGRYLVGAPRAVQTFVWQNAPGELDTFVDSDWAGCKATCRSTSGGAVKLGGHCIKTWSSTQATVAMSSAEAELYGLVKGAATSLGIISLCRDLGIGVNVHIHSDASATLAIIQRQGIGKLRHINVQYLWIQERVRNGEIRASKVPGKENPADLMTKHLPGAEIQFHMSNLYYDIGLSRAEIAPKLDVLNDAAEDNDDYWDYNAPRSTVTRHHDRPRRALFTPIRVRGAPPGKALTAFRRTTGTFLDNGECFTRVDNWTTRSTAHLPLDRAWLGSSTFIFKDVGEDQGQ